MLPSRPMAERGLFERLRAEGWPAITELIADQTPESLSLEFKCKAYGGLPGKLHDDDRKNLAKSISAFANTDGGCMIFGISTETGRAHDPDRAKAAQAVSDLGKFKQAVEAILKDVVNPAVPGIDLLTIEDQAGSDRGALAIHVPQSIARPHRANMGPGDVREHYYQRSASRSDIMPHSILAALMGRIPSPSLHLLLNLWIEQPSRLRFSLELRNAGRGSARQPAIRLFEAEPADRSLWSMALASTGLPDGWKATSTRMPGEEPTILLSTGSDAIVYPGDGIVLTAREPGTITGGWQWGRPVAFSVKGALYSADGAPVEFDRRLVAGAVRDARIQFDLPGDGT